MIFCRIMNFILVLITKSDLESVLDYTDLYKIKSTQILTNYIQSQYIHKARISNI